MNQAASDTQQPHTCVICDEKTDYPIELNDKMYCSSTWIRKYRDEVGERQFEKDSIANF